MQLEAAIEQSRMGAALLAVVPDLGELLLLRAGVCHRLTNFGGQAESTYVDEVDVNEFRVYGSAHSDFVDARANESKLWEPFESESIDTTVPDWARTAVAAIVLVQEN